MAGPRLLTFADAAHEIANATGRKICHRSISPEVFASTLVDQHVPPDVAKLLIELFTVTLDGRKRLPR